MGGLLGLAHFHMAYTYQHYPLALYLRGAFMAVADKAEEDAMRAEGWSDWHEDQSAMGAVASDGDAHLRLLKSTLHIALPPVEAAPQPTALPSYTPDQAVTANVKRKYTRKAK
jgi:hypothetical protein